MKTWVNILAFSALALLSCKDDDVAIFDKTSEVRASEAIANLKQELVAPANGWLIKYRPESETGSFYVLMDFNEDNTVNIKTDFGNSNVTYFEETVTYRIDNSLGLELIIESYSFFSYLFEQGMATYLAEYEFNFVNKTPDDALVFTSKTDADVPTILLFQPATEQDANILATEVATNLTTIAADLNKASSTLKLSYDNRDVVLYMTLDNLRRQVSIHAASRKTNPLASQNVNFTSPYVLKGDSIVFDNTFTATLFGNNISFNGIRFGNLSEVTIDACADPIDAHAYSGVTSNGEAVRMETSLSDAGGKNFTQSDFYNAALGNIFNNGQSAGGQIAQDVPGAQLMQLYYNYNAGGGARLYGIGFYIVNPNGTVTFALKQFTPTLVDNKLSFDFEADFSYFGAPATNPNEDNMNVYLEHLTEGDNTYVFKLADGLYEFHNPCTGWSFIFQDGN